MDIVKRLREISGIKKSFPMQGDDLEGQAADEIERLREALRKIDAVKYYGPEGASMKCDEMHEIARAALKEGP